MIVSPFLPSDKLSGGSDMIVEAEAGGDAFDGDMTGSVVGARFCNGGHVKDHVCNCGIWLDRFEALECERLCF